MFQKVEQASQGFPGTSYMETFAWVWESCLLPSMTNLYISPSKEVLWKCNAFNTEKAR